MNIKRDSIYIGEVFKQDFLSLQCVRKILFTLDKDANKGIDLINEGISYGFSSGKEANINIAQTFALDKILEDLGYPETLTKENIDKLINQDFYSAIIESGVYHELQNIIGENRFNIEFYQNNMDAAHADFVLHGEEVKDKPKSFVKRLFEKRGN